MANIDSADGSTTSRGGGVWNMWQDSRPPGTDMPVCWAFKQKMPHILPWWGLGSAIGTGSSAHPAQPLREDATVTSTFKSARHHPEWGTGDP